MKNPNLLGALAGLCITAVLYLLLTPHGFQVFDEKNILNLRSPVSERDPVGAPISTVLYGFNTNFPGSGDMLLYRSSLKHPHASLTNWDQAIAKDPDLKAMNSSSACRISPPRNWISIRPEQLRPMLEGQSNILIIPHDFSRCFVLNSRLIVSVDDPLNARSVVELPAVISFLRLTETSILDFPANLLVALGIKREDLSYLAFGSQGPADHSQKVTLLLFKLMPEKPNVEPFKVPAFLPYAEAIAPSKLEVYINRMNDRFGSAYLVDTRDLRAKSAGSLAGVIDAPLQASDTHQLKFRIDAPVRAIAGASFDTKNIPQDRLAPLILLGNDETDASVVWWAMHLRVLGYRRLAFVYGGLEALKRESPNFRL